MGPRAWACPDLPTNLVLESDSSVQVGQSGTNLMICASQVSGDYFVIARLATNGSIVASARINPFWVQGAVDSYMWRVAKYPDGSTLVENEIIQKKLPANVDVRIRVIAGGVTFEDLSTERWITAADFSDVGEYKFRLLKPAGTPTACHIVQMYQAGALIGEAYYDGNLMPQE